MPRSNRAPMHVSVVDPPGMEPALAFVVQTIHGGQSSGSISLATARALIEDLQTALTTAERISRDRNH